MTGSEGYMLLPKADMTVQGSAREEIFPYCTINSDSCQPSQILDGEMRFKPESFFGSLTSGTEATPWIQLDLLVDKEVTQVMLGL